MPEKEENWRIERNWTYFCNLLHSACSFWPISSQQRSFSTTSLTMTCAKLYTFYTSLSENYSRWYLRWNFKASIQIEVSLLMGNDCIQTFYPNLMPLCTWSRRHNHSLSLSSLWYFSISLPWKCFLKSRWPDVLWRQTTPCWRWSCNNKTRHLACTSLDTWTTCGAALCWNALQKSMGYWHSSQTGIN